MGLVNSCQLSEELKKLPATSFQLPEEIVKAVSYQLPEICLATSYQLQEEILKAVSYQLSEINVRTQICMSINMEQPKLRNRSIQVSRLKLKIC